MTGRYGSVQKTRDFSISIPPTVQSRLSTTLPCTTTFTDYVSTVITCGQVLFAGGLNRIHLRTREVRHYEKGEASNTLNADNIFSIYKSSTGELWIGTTSGLMRYNRKTDDFTRIPEMNKIFVYNILEDCHGKLWLATYSDGVFCYDLPQDKWKQYTRNPDNPNSLPYNKCI